MFSFDHVAISVDKVEESLNFYEKLGFEKYQEYYDEKVDLFMLKMAEIKLEIFHYHEHVDLPSFAKDLAEDLHVVGTKHLALQTDDIDSAKVFLEERGLKLGEIKKGRLGRRYFFLQDPNGIFIEIIER